MRRVGIALLMLIALSWVLAGCLAALSARAWLRRRESAKHVPARSASATVAVPVVTPAEPRAPVPVPVAAGAVGSEPTAGPTASGADAAAPTGFAIKAKESSGLYHTPSSPAWSRMHADVWFEDEEAAQAAGYKRWDWRRDRS